MFEYEVTKRLMENRRNKRMQEEKALHEGFSVDKKKVLDLLKSGKFSAVAKLFLDDPKFEKNTSDEDLAREQVLDLMLADGSNRRSAVTAANMVLSSFDELRESTDLKEGKDGTLLQESRKVTSQEDLKKGDVLLIPGGKKKTFRLEIVDLKSEEGPDYVQVKALDDEGDLEKGEIANWHVQSIFDRIGSILVEGVVNEGEKKAGHSAMSTYKRKISEGEDPLEGGEDLHESVKSHIEALGEALASGDLEKAKEIQGLMENWRDEYFDDKKKMTCPKCGHKGVNWDFETSEMGEMKCPKCGHKFQD